MKEIIKNIVYSFPSSLVLMFHHVQNNPSIQNSGCVLSTSLFYEEISKFENYIKIEDLLKSYKKKKTVVTFDDGLEDLYTIAYPFLKERKIPFTAFIVTDFLGKKGYITKKQLKELAKDPLVTIGSHGVTHKILTSLEVKDKEKEIVDSKKILEDLIGKEVKTFASSHGQFDKECFKYLKVYDSSFSATGLPFNVLTKSLIGKYKIPRINIDNNCYEKSNNKILKINYK